MYVLYMLISDNLYPLLYNDWILFAVAFTCKCEQSEGAQVKKHVCSPAVKKREPFKSARLFSLSDPQH